MMTSTTATPSLAQPKPKTRVSRSRTQWKSLVEKFNSSGLTKSAFCKHHGVTTSCFYRWQKILAEESAPANFIDITEPVASAVVPRSVPETHNHWQVELELGAGVILRMRTS